MLSELTEPLDEGIEVRPFRLHSHRAWAGSAVVLTDRRDTIEVERRLGDTALAFARARAIFVLGSLEAFAVGMVITSLLGRIMVSRNWSPEGGGELPVEVLRHGLEPLLGQLPHVIGVAPFYAFPSSVLMMTFLSFFIGIFLQLMWEELPITEPL